MARGLEGWCFPKEIDWKKLRILGLIFMTFGADRPQGHVGILIEMGDKQYMMAHASETAGFVAVPVTISNWAGKAFNWGRLTDWN